MKNKTCYRLLLILAFMILGHRVQAAAPSDSQSIQIDLVPGNQSSDLIRSITYLGEEISIGVNARIDSGLISAYQFDLVYSPAEVSVVSVIDQGFFSILSKPVTGVQYSNGAGRLTVTESLLGGETGVGRTTSGAELLVQITLKVLKEGNKALTLENAQFTDNSGTVPGTPRDITNNLNSETSATLQGPGIKDNLDQFTIFPNPYKPNDGDNNTGIPYDGSTGSGIVFLNLPSEVRLKIYTVSGKLVFEKSIYNQAQWNWDIRNNRNETVASGLYLYSMKSLTTGQTRSGKLMIVR